MTYSIFSSFFPDMQNQARKKFARNRHRATRRRNPGMPDDAHAILPRKGEKGLGLSRPLPPPRTRASRKRPRWRQHALTTQIPLNYCPAQTPPGGQAP